MDQVTITAEHWQAALEVPKEVALDAAAPLNVRLQAAKMVQDMVKVILKQTIDREKLTQKNAASASKTSRSPITSDVGSSVQADLRPTTKRPASPLPSQTPAAEKIVRDADAIAPPIPDRVERATVPLDETSFAPSQSTCRSHQGADTAEERHRYIGRVGPRKLQGKAKKSAR